MDAVLLCLGFGQNASSGGLGSDTPSTPYGNTSRDVQNAKEKENMQPPTEDDYNTGCDTSTLCGTTDDNAGKENGQEPFTEVDAKEINGEVGRDALTDDGSTTSIEFCLDQDQCSRQSDIEEADNDIVFGLGSKCLIEIPNIQPRRILCTGAGIGPWAITFSQTYREADVTVVENRPWRTDVPAKCRFEKASIDAYPPNSFDFILMRNPRVEDEPNLFQQVRKLLLPGGYVQFVFIDRNICTCGSTAEWKQAKMCEICNKFRGTTILERFLVSWFRSTTNRKRLLADAGFESITTVSTGHYYSCPLDNSKATCVIYLAKVPEVE